MKKKIFGGILAVAIAAVAAVNVNINNEAEDALSALSLANVEALANDETGGESNGGGCRAGGPGSTSCTIQTEQLGTSRECSVTCQTGHYACCNITLLLSAECKCISG